MPIADSDQLNHQFEQSEIGPIPSDWDSSLVGDIVTGTQLGGNYANSDRETSWPLIKMGNMGRGSISLSKLEYVTSASPPQIRDRLKRGDVLFNTRNTLDLVGKVCIWNDEISEAYFNSNIMRFSFCEKRVSSHRFMNYVFNTDRMVAALRAIATGTTSVAAIYYRDLSKITVPLPPHEEQRAIAEALSDADALIESLESLIAKKRAIKQGAMQELLSGARRLPGFNGDWKETTLIELAEYRKELFDDGDWIEAEHLSTDGVRFVQTGNIGIGRFIERDEKKFVKSESVKLLRCKFLQPGDLLICRLADPPGRACVLPDIGYAEMVTSVDITIYRPPFEKVSRQFLQFLFSTRDWLSLVAERSGGTTHKRIARGALGKLSIRLPEVGEQNAIAEILTALDNEIGALEERQDKARQIKQGMMQDLLTGKVRLV